MKKDIHPTYKDATINCACGASFVAGSTRDDIHVDVCSNCHPFYTGKQKLVDTAGRVDKFKARVEAAKKFQEAMDAKKSAKKDKKSEATSEASSETPEKSDTSSDTSAEVSLEESR